MQMAIALDNLVHQNKLQKKTTQLIVGSNSFKYDPGYGYFSTSILIRFYFKEEGNEWDIGII